MDNWLKWLVATACVVVIGGGAYYAKSEYERSKEQKILENRQNAAFCRRMISDLSKNITKDYIGAHISWCINDDYVTEEDFTKAGAGAYLEQVRALLKTTKK